MNFGINVTKSGSTSLSYVLTLLKDNLSDKTLTGQIGKWAEVPIHLNFAEMRKKMVNAILQSYPSNLYKLVLLQATE